jgi:hypothetical protein
MSPRLLNPNTSKPIQNVNEFNSLVVDMANSVALDEAARAAEATLVTVPAELHIDTEREDIHQSIGYNDKPDLDSARKIRRIMLGSLVIAPPKVEENIVPEVVEDWRDDEYKAIKSPTVGAVQKARARHQARQDSAENKNLVESTSAESKAS